jgi:hypothetical protein
MELAKIVARVRTIVPIEPINQTRAEILRSDLNFSFDVENLPSTSSKRKAMASSEPTAAKEPASCKYLKLRVNELIFR